MGLKDVSALDTIRNDDICKALNLTSLEEKIHTYGRKWLDYLLKMNDERVPKQALHTPKEPW